MSQFYYENNYPQWGGGNRIGRVYAGAPFQHGAGIGSFLGGVYRYVLPLLKRSATAVGKEMLQTGLNIASDVGELKKPFKQAFKERMRQSGSNLQQKAKDNLDRFMKGDGYKMGSKSLPLHLAAALGREKKKRTGRKKKSGALLRRKLKENSARRRRRLKNGSRDEWARKELKSAKLIL